MSAKTWCVWIRVKLFVLLMMVSVSVVPVVHAVGYIESTVWSPHGSILSQDDLTLKVDIYNGPGTYFYNIFKSQCTGGGINFYLNYVVAPKSVTIGSVNIPLIYSGNKIADIGNDWVVIATVKNVSSGCVSSGSGNSEYAPGVNALATGSLVSLPPGTYNYSMQFYVGNAFGDTLNNAIQMIKDYALTGAISSTPSNPFTGLASCEQDSTTPGTTIDFGTIISNGSVQSGPLTMLGLVCNYDVALNDVTYSLTSNNPVTGEPSAGQKVAVALTNGATVTLDGGNVTQPDPKRVSVNITPSIDTRGAAAGEGTGSATLTFNYE
ncbi:hypothetical protein [Serratia marcescens]|uniref:hypothetical protein n=1 Tax=Serratia marcescens TaxID=615 RepID=UPI0011AF4CE4|nr:hypothetical protein [Serratia marcescens]WLS88718.1 hypothetical protein RAM09_04535 [Serratia marcescens]